MPVTLTPSTSAGPVQPLGLRRMIIGQRGRRPSQRPLRADCWISVIIAYAVASAAAKR